MKKILQSILLITSLSASAQCSLPKLDSIGMFDDFSSVTPPSNINGSGIYIWGQPTLTNGFQSIVDRTGGKFNASITQAAGAYNSFGISFGDSNGDGTGKPYYIDLSGDKTFSADFINNSDSTLKIRMTIQDSAAKEIDTYAAYSLDAGTFSDVAWMYVVELEALPHSTVSFSPSNKYPNTYAGGAKSDYGTKSYTTGFDFTRVKGIYFTVTNSGHDKYYTPNGFSNLSVSLDNVKLGNCPVGINAVSSIENIRLFPNPTTDIVNVSLQLNQISSVNIVVTDLFGKPVKTIMNGKLFSVDEQVSVSDLSPGVYIVNYIVDGATGKSALLMIK